VNVKSIHPVPTYVPDNLASVFGKTEMEYAAMRILSIVCDKGTWDVSLSPLDFVEDEYELEGFCFLIGYNWLKFVDGCSEHFKIRSGFIKKVMEKRQEIFFGEGRG